MGKVVMPAVLAAALTVACITAASAQLQVRQASPTIDDAVIAPGQTFERSIVLQPGRAFTLRLPRTARDVVVGSTDIANPVPSSDDVITIYGKGVGVTDLIVYDTAGSAMVRTTVRVNANRTGVLVNTGDELQSYICAPQCVTDQSGVEAARTQSRTVSRTVRDGRGGHVTTSTTSSATAPPPAAPSQ